MKSPRTSVFLFSLSSLSPEEMERFDDNNSLKGGFLLLLLLLFCRFWCTYRRFPRKKQNKAAVNYSCLQALSWFTIVRRRHKRDFLLLLLQALHGALSHPGVASFCVSLKILFSLCFVILRRCGLNQRKFGYRGGALFCFFSVVVLFALSLFSFFPFLF